MVYNKACILTQYICYKFEKNNISVVRRGLTNISTTMSTNELLACGIIVHAYMSSADISKKIFFSKTINQELHQTSVFSDLYQNCLQWLRVSPGDKLYP